VSTTPYMYLLNHENNSEYFINFLVQGFHSLHFLVLTTYVRLYIKYVVYIILEGGSYYPIFSKVNEA
jgi:hypothetical protein